MSVPANSATEPSKGGHVPPVSTSGRPADMSLGQLQDLIAQMYGSRDSERGPSATLLWLVEEIGELAAAVRHYECQDRTPGSAESAGARASLDGPHGLAEEFADVLAWLATLANIVNVDLAAAVEKKYGCGCPGCGETPCTCDVAEKP